MPFAEPELAYRKRGRYAVTNEPAYTGRSVTVIVAKGFITDLATSPRILWALIPPFGVYEAAAVLHDWLLKLLRDHHMAMERYRQVIRSLEGQPEKWPEAPKPPAISSVDADGLFRRVMREGGVGFFTRWVMWGAVRWAALFTPSRRAGWLSWPETPLLLLITLAELAVLAGLALLIHTIVGWFW